MTVMALPFTSDKCSNQTVAGLKHKLGTLTLSSLLCSNQTVAGLKLDPSGFAALPPRSFKSDRCGIETWDLPGCDDWRSEGSNQTVAGLKLTIRHTKYGLVCSSNQTVAGLKRGFTAFNRAVCLCSNQTVAGLKL